MSNNKTVIPGLENTTPSAQTSVQGGNPVYGQYDGHTVIPGINPGTVIPVPQVNSKPIVGFLFSISRTGKGEYWPLHVGPNSIGRLSSCDVYLPEATVSEQHAELVVRIDKNPEKVRAAITDTRSTCGTMINGESLGFEPRSCVNGDIITIGEHYDLYVTLIDVKQLGLKVCQDFIPVDAEQLYAPSGQQQPIGGGTQFYSGAQQGSPSTQVIPPVPPVYQPGRTVGVDNATNPRTEPGKTIFM